MSNQWSEYIQFQTRKNKVMISNVFTGQVLVISEECFSYIEYFISMNYEVNIFINEFKDKDDKEYVRELISKLQNMHAFANDPFYNDIYKKLEFTWSLTNRCNLSCIHCCVSANNEEIDLPFSKLKEIADKILSTQPAHITITGGEPLIHHDFVKIIAYLKKEYRGSLSLLTNGLLINEENATFIVNTFSSVSISLDGYDEESSSMIRGNYVFDKAISAIQLLKSKGMKNISASMIVTEHTKDNTTLFTALCKDLHIQPLLRGLEHIGRGKENKDKLEIKYSSEINKINDTYGIYKKRPKPMIFTCKGAFLTFYINHKGLLLPCSTLSEERFQMGNVLEIDHFNEYIKEKKYINTAGFGLFESYKPYNLKHCKKCHKNLLCFSCVCDVINSLDNNIDDICHNTGTCFDYCWEVK